MSMSQPQPFQRLKTKQIPKFSETAILDDWDADDPSDTEPLPSSAAASTSAAAAAGAASSKNDRGRAQEISWEEDETARIAASASSNRISEQDSARSIWETANRSQPSAKPILTRPSAGSSMTPNLPPASLGIMPPQILRRASPSEAAARTSLQEDPADVERRLREKKEKYEEARRRIFGNTGEKTGAGRK